MGWTLGSLLSAALGSRRRRGSQTRYYFCRHHTLEPGEHTHPAHRADELEAGFFALLQAGAGRPDVALIRDANDALEALKRREKALEKALVDLDRRRARVWSLAEGQTLTGAQLRERLDEIDLDRSNTSQQLADVRASRAESEESLPEVSSLAQLYGKLARSWPDLPIDQQREVARAVAALPSIHGLWADPSRRGRLLTGKEVTSLSLVDLTDSIAPFPGKRLIGLLKGPAHTH